MRRPHWRNLAAIVGWGIGFRINGTLGVIGIFEFGVWWGTDERFTIKTLTWLICGVASLINVTPYLNHWMRTFEKPYTHDQAERGEPTAF